MEGSSGCYLAPVCVVANEACSVVVCSVRLAMRVARAAGSSGTQSVCVLLARGGVLEYEATAPATGQALLRFDVPARALRRPGVLSVLLALCGPEGRVERVVDSGRLLVFPADAAGEVRAMFARTTAEVRALLRGVTPPATAQLSAPRPQQHQHQQQEQPSAQAPAAAPPLLQRAWASLAGRLGAYGHAAAASADRWPSRMQRRAGSADSDGSSRAGSSHVGTSHAGTSSHAGGAGARADADARRGSDGGTPGAALPGASPPSCPPDVATLYAYEHFVVPFVRRCETAFAAAPRASASHGLLAGGGGGGALGGGLLLQPAAADAHATQLLDFMLDNEMWASCVLLLGRYPRLLRQVQQAGLELPGDFANPIILERLRAALGTRRSSGSGGGSSGSGGGSSGSGGGSSGGQHAGALAARLQRLQQQQQRRQQQPAGGAPPAQALEQVAGLAQQQPALLELPALQQLANLQGAGLAGGQGLLLLDTDDDACLSSGSDLLADGEADNSSGSYENASAILRQLAALQQAHGEQEALMELERLSRERRERPRQQRQQRQQQEQQHEPPLQQQPQQPAQHPHAGAGAAAAAGGSSGHDPAPQPHQRDAAPAAAAARRTTVGGMLRQRKCSWEEEHPPASISLCQRRSAEEPGWLLPPAAAEPCVPAPATAADPAAASVDAWRGQAQQRASCCSDSSHDRDCGAGSASPRSAAGTDCSCGSGKRSSGGSDTGAGCCKRSSIEWERSSGGGSAAGAVAAAPFAQLARAAALGFADRHLESSYLVFKNHGCSLLDATAGLLCSGMLIASTVRSVSPSSDPHAWAKLALLLAYGLCFMFPYALMRARLRTFLRWREPLLVGARASSAGVLVLMARGLVPPVAAWQHAVVNTWAMQLQNGFILPSAQPVRLRAAALIAAAQMPSDALMFCMGRPLGPALGHALATAAAALLVTLVQDARWRARFLHSYRGAAAPASPRARAARPPERPSGAARSGE